MERKAPIKQKAVDRKPPPARTTARPKEATIKRKPMKVTRRPSDGPWRDLCADRRGLRCRAEVLGGCDGALQCDHIWPKSQTGPSVVENGAFLCRRHHTMKTEAELRYRFEWLDQDQVEWLAKVGWVVWDAAGQPSGRGWKHFEPRVVHPSTVGA
jgi:5-methylcytosine-specific restriction endonuclease McrA